MTAFEPNISNQKKKFEPIEYAMNPNYENYVKMWKLYTDTHFNLDYRSK